MTSLATIVGIMPIALGRGAGGEARASMGIAVVSGLLFSTVLSFFLVPATYVVVARVRNRLGRRTVPASTAAVKGS